jgi:hemerythrin-like domain-containing protein
MSSAESGRGTQTGERKGSFHEEMTSGSYDPIAVLMEEHRQFLHRLERFANEVRGVSNRDRIPPVLVRQIAEFSRFLERDVDGWHGRKEEQALFPSLKRHLSVDEGPIAVLLEEHELLRQHQRVIERDARKLERDPGATEALSEIGSAESQVRGLLTDHIDKEDRILFPMARELLTDRELGEVAAFCQEIDALRDGTSER